MKKRVGKQFSSRGAAREAAFTSAGARPRIWPVSLDEFETAAAKRLSPLAYAYISGGAGDEGTMRRNRETLAAIRLKQRVMVDVSRLDPSMELLGETLEFPILLAPTAYHRLSHKNGEIETVRGANAARTPMIVSTLASTTVEEIAAAAQVPLWFQLYVNPDRGFTRDLVARAEAAGCRALCLTVDSPVFGVRNREARVRFRLPKGVEAVHFKMLGHGAEHLGHISDDGVYSPMVDPSLTWQDLDWLCSVAKTPVMLKGIQLPEDARLAVEHGAAGVIVSNHGGRNLDGLPATIEALPGVAEAVQGRVPVLFDGGVRRGADIFRALALGATAALIGRPYVYGLALGGAAGVAEVVRILRDEFRAAMALCGTPTIADISRRCLWRGE